MPARVLEIVTDISGIDPGSIQPDSRFTADLRMDELEPVEVAFALEEEFGIYLSDADAEAIGTVADLIEFVRCALTRRESNLP